MIRYTLSFFLISIASPALSQKTFIAMYNDLDYQGAALTFDSNTVVIQLKERTITYRIAAVTRSGKRADLYSDEVYYLQTKYKLRFKPVIHRCPKAFILIYEDGTRIWFDGVKCRIQPNGLDNIF